MRSTVDEIIEKFRRRFDVKVSNFNCHFKDREHGCSTEENITLSNETQNLRNSVETSLREESIEPSEQSKIQSPIYPMELYASSSAPSSRGADNSLPSNSQYGLNYGPAYYQPHEADNMDYISEDSKRDGGCCHMYSCTVM